MKRYSNYFLESKKRPARIPGFEESEVIFN